MDAPESRNAPSTTRFVHRASPATWAWMADMASAPAPAPGAAPGAPILVSRRSSSPLICVRLRTKGPVRWQPETTRRPSICAVSAIRPGRVQSRMTNWRVRAPRSNGASSKRQSVRRIGAVTSVKPRSRRPVMCAPVRRSAGRSPGAGSAWAPSSSAARASARITGSGRAAGIPGDAGSGGAGGRDTSTRCPCGKASRNRRSQALSSSMRTSDDLPGAAACRTTPYPSVPSAFPPQAGRRAPRVRRRAETRKKTPPRKA
ncbi:hypothetical protein RKD48_004606 [Streptomyces ambofaciens]